jgi:phage/plasmid-like protein (TIGR03299 family)
VAHNLFGERFLGRRTPAWHNLGTTFDEPYTASQAVEIAGLDYNVFTTPLFADVHGLRIPTDKFAIVREPTPDDPEFRILGAAGKNYEVLNNTDIAAILDPLTEHWPVETIGALGMGETIFMTLALGSTDIKGDSINEYFLVTEGKTGGDSVTIAYTPIRVVCQNTLSLGLSAATIKSAVVHTTGARAALKFQVDIMARLRLARERSLEALTALADSRIYPDQAAKVFRSAYPDPQPSAKAALAQTLFTSKEDFDDLLAAGPGRELLSATALHQYMLDRADKYREACSDCYLRFSDEQPQFANTAYAAYNAVVEVVDFAGSAKSDGSPFSATKVATKERAFRAALSLN